MEIFSPWRYSVSWLRACSGVKHACEGRASFQNETMHSHDTIHDHTSRFWSETLRVFHILITWNDSTVLKPRCQLHVAQPQPRWDEDDCEMMTHSTVDNQPWAVRGEGRGRERREGSLWSLGVLYTLFSVGYTPPQKSLSHICHWGHVSVCGHRVW